MHSVQHAHQINYSLKGNLFSRKVSVNSGRKFCQKCRAIIQNAYRPAPTSGRLTFPSRIFDPKKRNSLVSQDSCILFWYQKRERKKARYFCNEIVNKSRFPIFRYKFSLSGQKRCNKQAVNLKTWIPALKIKIKKISLQLCVYISKTL